jgi:Domain of unknown function (DUF4190)
LVPCRTRERNAPGRPIGSIRAMSSQMPPPPEDPQGGPPNVPQPPPQYPPAQYPPQGYQPQQYPPQGYQQSYPIVHRTNGMSVASLVLGIVGVVLFGLFMIPNILAVIFGFVGISQINGAQGTQGGRGLAIAWIVLGFVGIAFFLLVVAFGTVDVHFGPNT